MLQKGQLTVNKKALTIIVDDLTIEYASAVPEFTFTYYGLENNDNLGDEAYTDYTQYAAVGTYYIRIRDNTYTNYIPTFINGTLTVAKATGRVLGDKVQNYTYNGTQILLDVTLNHSEAPLNFAPAQGYVNAGSYQITVTSPETVNYTAVSEVFTLIIDKRELRVNIDSKEKIYGESDPALDFTYSNLLSGDVVTGALARTAGEDVGDYAINAGTVSAGQNYVTVITEAYLVIKQRPLTITAHAATKIYGDAESAFEYSITSGNLVGTDTLSGKLSREPGIYVGTYELNIGTLGNSNYAITFVPEFLTITKRPITITADDMTKVYGDADPELSYSITSGSLAYDDTISAAVARAEGEDVGVISPRPITITANSMSFLHGSAERIDLTYTISGEPLPEDEELIASAISITSSARPDSYVGNYPIYLNQIRPLNNYTVTMINSVLKILNGDITDVYFEDMKVLYDGYEQVLLASGEVSKYNVEYKNNAGTEVGVYRATAIFTKENYNDLVLEAKLIIMTNKISTSEIIPQGIITIESGVDPYVVPIIVNNSDIKTLEHAEELITLDKEIGESVKSITNINLFSNGAAIPLDGVAEVRMLIPSNITDVSTLRIAFVSGDTTYDVAYEIDGEYIVFEAYELGDYAFITETHEIKEGDRVASVLLYVGIGVLVFILVGFIATGFTIKRRKRDQAKYI